MVKRLLKPLIKRSTLRKVSMPTLPMQNMQRVLMPKVHTLKAVITTVLLRITAVASTTAAARWLSA